MNQRQAAQFKKRAWAMLDLGNFDEALGLFDQAIEAEPGQLNHVLEKGVATFRMARYEQALEVFDAVLERDPNNITALNNGAKCLVHLDDIEEALAYYRDSLTINPDHPKTWMDAGRAMTKIDAFERALTCFDEALDRDPNNPEIWYQRGVALRASGSQEEGLKAFNRAISLSKDNHFEALRDRGALLRALGKHSDASDSLQQALRLKPGSADVEIELGELLLELNQASKAFQIFERIVKRERDQAAAWDGKGRAFIAMGEPAHGALNRGMACMMRNKHEDALTLIDEAISHKQAYPEAWSNKGVVLNRMGRFEEAVECYKKALEYDPDVLVIMHNLGMILYYDLDRKHEALKYFKTTVLRDPKRWGKLPSEIRRGVDQL